MTDKRTLTIGLVGYKFMGKAHSNAWRQAPRFFDLPTHLRLKAICGRDAKAVRQAATTFGWETAVTNWRAVVDDPEIDICTPNDSHAEIAIAAAKAGKAILCEKPLARNVALRPVLVALGYVGVFMSDDRTSPLVKNGNIRIFC